MTNSYGDRVKIYIDRKNIIKADFCKTINISPETLRRWLNNENKITANHLIKIIEMYPDIDARWLITGNSDEKINIFSESKEEYLASNKSNKELIEVQRDLIKHLKIEIERLLDESNRVNPSKRGEAGRNASNF